MQFKKPNRGYLYHRVCREAPNAALSTLGLDQKSSEGEKKMKKSLVTLACIFVLYISIWTNLQILVTERVLATGNTPTGLSPALIRSAYNLPSSGGQGTTIAIIDPFLDPAILGDANAFCSQYGIPLLEAGTNYEEHPMPWARGDPSGQWAEETALDVEWAHAIAPNAKILLVEATEDQPNYLFAAVDYARGQPDVIAIVMSWGVLEFIQETGYDSYLQPWSNASCCFFTGAGDRCENVVYPACSPYVVSVGGTTLNFSGGSLVSETVWYEGIVGGELAGTGGGVSQYETEPSYQASYGVPGANGYRGVPDVSFDAGSKVSVYDSTPGPGGQYWLEVSGTSLGAAAWAAIYSIGLTASNPHFYAIAKSAGYSSCFRDITVGSNGNYNATSGYDFCTGLGSPITTIFTPACALKTKANGHFYVPNPTFFNATALRVEILFDNANLTGDQIGNATFPYPAIAHYPDKQVNLVDTFFEALKYGTFEGLSNWDYMADIWAHKKVNLQDYFTAALNFGRNGTYTTDLSGVAIVFGPSETKIWPDAWGFVAIPQGAGSFNVTRNDTSIGAMIIFFGP
jgi:subtilase family serine protease